MTKKQLYEIGKLMKRYYEQVKFDQEKLDAWYEILQDYDFETVKANLEAYVKHSDFPPKIKDLIAEGEKQHSIVPGYEETVVLLADMETGSPSEVAQQELAKMRAILGIKEIGDDGR
ncbi:MAG: replicative helicase loader/inhibitor [Bacillus sp. (in: firmicutes)]